MRVVLKGCFSAGLLLLACGSDNEEAVQQSSDGLQVLGGAAGPGAPAGWIDVTRCDGYVSGWTCDSDAPGRTVAVMLVVDGVARSVDLATGPREEAVGRTAPCGNNAANSAHGFHFQVPALPQNGSGHRVDVHVFDNETGRFVS